MRSRRVSTSRRLKATTASPWRRAFSGSGLGSSSTCCLRSKARTWQRSPHRPSRFCSAGTAYSEQMMITSLAGTPTMACVQAQPREASKIICASSITATSIGRLVSTISMVLDTARAPGAGTFSSPVSSEHGTPRATSRSRPSSASSRSGAR
jgi:hypothetical protein